MIPLREPDAEEDAVSWAHKCVSHSFGPLQPPAHALPAPSQLGSLQRTNGSPSSSHRGPQPPLPL